MLMTFRKTTIVYFKNFKHKYIVWENVYLFPVKDGGTHINILRGKMSIFFVLRMVVYT